MVPVRTNNEVRCPSCLYYVAEFDYLGMIFSWIWLRHLVPNRSMKYYRPRVNSRTHLLDYRGRSLRSITRDYGADGGSQRIAGSLHMVLYLCSLIQG